MTVEKPEGMPVHPKGVEAAAADQESAPKRMKLLEIIAGSPAAEAGLRPHDQIVTVDGQAVASVDSLKATCATPGDKLFCIQRGDQSLTLTVTPRYDPIAAKYIVGITMRQFSLIRNVDEAGVESFTEQLNGTIFDVDHKPICRYRVDIDPEEVYVGYGGGEEFLGQEIRRYVLVYDVNGVETEYDIGKHFNSYNIPMFIGNNQLAIQGGREDVQAGRVVTAVNDTPESIYLMLHELGHASQDDDPNLARLRKLYNSQRTYDPTQMWDVVMLAELTALIQDIMSCTPGGVNNVQFDAVLVTLKPKLKELSGILMRVGMSGSADTEAALEKDILARQQAIVAHEVKSGVTVFDILSLPTAVVERDADARALRSLRKIKKDTGIDLFKKFTLERAKNVAEESVSGYAAVQDEFRRAVQTEFAVANIHDTVKGHAERIAATSAKMRKIRRGGSAPKDDGEKS